MPWNCCQPSKKHKNIKNNKYFKKKSNSPEDITQNSSNIDNKKPRKSKLYNNLQLEQCERNIKTNNSSSLDSQFDSKSINELNEHLYDSYDTLPNLKSKVSSGENNKNLFINSKHPNKCQHEIVVRPKHLLLCVSNEELPFMDSISDTPTSSCYQNERIINLLPTNLPCQESTQRRYYSNESDKLCILQRSQNHHLAHKFIQVDVMDSKICMNEKCHKLLNFKTTYKCSLCDYFVHKKCAFEKPEIRYTDTSYLIFRQWDGKNGLLAYPTCSINYKPHQEQQLHEQSRGISYTNNYSNEEMQKEIEKNESSSKRASSATYASKEQEKSLTTRCKTLSNIWQLSYVTERILAAVLPCNTNQSRGKLNDENGNPIHDKDEFELLQMLEQKHGQNFRLFDLESCLASITLEKLCELCKHIESWLGVDNKKVVVLQDRGNYQRLGTSVAAFLQYQKICSLNLAPYSLSCSGDGMKSLQDLDEYSMQKFLDDSVVKITDPSYKRYLEYFTGLLTGQIKLNSRAIHLKYIKMDAPPCMLQKTSIYEQEWSSFLKIFEGERFIFISDVYVMPISTRQFIYEIKNPLKLRGDVFIHFFQINNKSQQTHFISSIQFHTCATSSNQITFNKSEIELAFNDDRFPIDHQVTLIFDEEKSSPQTQSDVMMFQNPLIRIEPLSSFSSVADLAQYTQGPVDGNLYATITKSSLGNSPEALYELTARNVETIDTRLNSSNFKNTRLLSTILEWDNMRNENPEFSNKTKMQTLPRSSSSQSTTQRRKIQDQRSFIKNPLHLSIDSGIYSNEVFNKQNLSSALSSSAWHSETTSPQDSCQNKLDTLLSDMMMTIKTLPDFHPTQAFSNENSYEIPSRKHYDRPNSAQQFSNSEKKVVQTSLTNINNVEFNENESRDINCETSSMTTTLTPTASGQTTPMYDHQRNYQDFDLYYDTDTQVQLNGGKRNQYTENTRRKEYQKQNDNRLQINPSQSYSNIQETQSENEIGSNRSDKNIPYHAREYSKPFTYGTVPLSYEDSMITNKLNSPSMVRKADTRNIGTATKTTRVSIKKFPSNDFEQMLHERQSEKYSFGDKINVGLLDDEKVGYNYNKRANVKYNGSNSNISDVNGSYFEPLKRANTMDDSFNSGGYASDGYSGQTWLQVQQQRLRVRQAQQHRPDFTDNNSRRSQTLSPVRNYHTISSKQVTKTAKEPQFVEVRRVTQQNMYKPVKNDTLDSSYGSDRGRNTFQKHANEHYNTNNDSPRRTNDGLAQRNKNNIESGDDQSRQTLDNLLESLAIENFTSEKCLLEIDHFRSKVNIPVINNLSSNGLLITVHNNNNTSLMNHDHNKTINTTNHNNINKQKSDSAHLNECLETQVRNESMSSYRYESDNEVSRPETPAFPVTPRSPYVYGSTSTLPPKSPTLQRRDLSVRVHHEIDNSSANTSRRNSNSSTINSEPLEIAAHHVNFARDSSKYWYKPTISREEAINLLRDAQPGTFLVRDSTTFANAFGLVLKVAHPPPGAKGGSDELVRHFLVEPTVRGVRLKGCSNEPVFSSLSALIYQHSITAMAIPCRLTIPDRDIQVDFQSPAKQQLASQGAACNVLYLFSTLTEQLTGPQAVRKAITLLFERRPLPTPTEVHFKVAQQGITLTDTSRQLFFRKHYPANTVSYFGLDPDDHRWSVQVSFSDIPVANYRIFAFVAKRTSTSMDNQCHLFCELEQRQPAAAIVSFANKIILEGGTLKQYAVPQI